MYLTVKVVLPFLCGLKGSPTRVIKSFENESGKRKCKFISPIELNEIIDKSLNKNTSTDFFDISSDKKFPRCTLSEIRLLNLQNQLVMIYASCRFWMQKVLHMKYLLISQMLCFGAETYYLKKRRLKSVQC